MTKQSRHIIVKSERSAAIPAESISILPGSPRRAKALLVMTGIINCHVRKMRQHFELGIFGFFYIIDTFE